jgi:hypothetical protein
MTVSISGAIDFLQDKYVLSPALQGPVISSSIIGGVGIGEWLLIWERSSA